MGKMTPKFAIKVLCSAKVAPIQGIPGNPVEHGCQNQQFYAMARDFAVSSIRENAVLHKKIKELSAQVVELTQKVQNDAGSGLSKRRKE